MYDWFGWYSGGEKGGEERLGLTKPVVTIATAMASLMSPYCIQSGSRSLMDFRELMSERVCVCVCVFVCVRVCVCVCACVHIRERV